MKAFAEIRQAARSLGRFKRRTFFMMLGVMVGITSLTVLNSLGEGTKRETMKRVKNMLGTFDTVIIRPGGGKSRGMVSLANVEPSLRFEDANAIATELPGIKQVALLQNAFDVDVKYRDRTASPGIFGVSVNWLDLRGDQLAEGVFFTENDQRSLARIAVLGLDAKTALFPDGDALGKSILIGGVPFQVTGVLASRGAGPTGGSLDNLVLIPVTTASRRLFNRDFLTMAIAQLRDPARGDQAVQNITRLLRERHHLAPAALDDFTITNPSAVMARLTNVSSTLSQILTGVAALAMLIGGVVITSLMLIGVSERRKEIGIRRSVGASQLEILLQFLLEALGVSLLGGALGVAAGLGGANALAIAQKMPPIFSQDTVLLSVVLSTAVGLVFGLYPAWKAARVDPIEALRG
jgi:putative ABC transport system permease protein